ncbi:aldehyde dehydrogenase family protein [Streptomyces carpinensis]|uniref:Aldehyde dehydrogenase family protein n=1 Tax=Streptomyces carpinensis TaxID=66369 RepID=A0ABV1VYI0_9ACTN
MQVARQPRVGAVWINSWGSPEPPLPWSGRGAGGLGSELGLSGLQSYRQEKTCFVVL